TTVHPDGEFAALVLRRVRQLSILFLVGYSAFFIRELTAPANWYGWLPPIGFLIVIPMQLTLVGLLYSAWPNSFRRIRGSEWFNLGLICTFLGVNQFRFLADPAATRDLRDSASGEMQVLIANSWLLPWVVLIIGYGVVVPNPARRAFLMAVLTALVPVV